MQYKIPPYKFFLYEFVFLLSLVISFGIYWLFTHNNLFVQFLTIIFTTMLGGVFIFLLLVFIILRPIRIQIDDPGIILYYHHRKPVYVTWDMIEFVSRYDTDSLFRKIDRMGKMKVRSQKYPFFMPFDVAKAIMDAYKGSGQISTVGKGVLIKN